MASKVNVGQHVVYTDAAGVDRDALVIQVLSDRYVNLVIVSRDARRENGDDRPIDRTGTVPHMSCPWGVHGQVWRLPGEPRPERPEPQET